MKLPATRIAAIVETSGKTMSSLSCRRTSALALSSAQLRENRSNMPHPPVGLPGGIMARAAWPRSMRGAGRPVRRQEQQEEARAVLAQRFAEAIAALREPEVDRRERAFVTKLDRGERRGDSGEARDEAAPAQAAAQDV